MRVMRDLKKRQRSIIESIRDLCGRAGATYKGAVAYEFRKPLVFFLVDFLLQDAESHWLLDDIIIIGNIALVDAALE